VLESVVLRDPDRCIPWTIVCDQKSGAPLPAFLVQTCFPLRRRHVALTRQLAS